MTSSAPRGRQGKAEGGGLGRARATPSQMSTGSPPRYNGPLAHYQVMPFHGMWPHWMSCYTGLAVTFDNGSLAGVFDCTHSGSEEVFALSDALDDAKEELSDARSDIRDCQRRLQTALASIEQLGDEVKDLRNYQWRYKHSEEELSDMVFENATVDWRAIVHPRIPYIRRLWYVCGARWEDAGFLAALTGCSSRRFVRSIRTTA